MQEVKSGRDEQRERDMTTPKVKPETEELRKKSLGRWGPFYLILIVCLPQLILKLQFSKRQF